MSHWSPVNMASTFLICLATISSAQTALACSVCYGDPNSPMTKGVEAGVLVLLGVVGTVLTGLACSSPTGLGRFYHSPGLGG